jgi:hypothetical protein
MDRDSSNQSLALDSAELPDLLDWERRPSTQMIPEKAVISSPYIGGSEGKPRDIRTLRRWRTARRGPLFLKIGGRYFYRLRPETELRM